MKTWYAALPAALLLLATSTASAAPGDTGYDVSHPQCKGSKMSSTPAGTPVFGIVGVNNGTAWNANGCLQAEVNWAAALHDPPMLYLNTANPAPKSTNYWPTSGSRDPVLCAQSTSTTDPGCAYDYGWHTAADAFAKASALSQGAGYARSLTWWLDVEQSGTTGNTWNGDGLSNAADLQGMVDRLRSEGVPRVGIYSTASAWTAVTAASAVNASSYTRSTSNAYRARWGFSPSYPIEDGPVWLAGVGDVTAAKNRCTSNLTAGQVLLSQYVNGSFDGDYRCADPDTVAPTVSMAAPAPFIVTGSSVRLSWSGSDTGSGVASFDAQGRRAAYNTGFGAVTMVTSRYLSGVLSVPAPPHGQTACWQARSRDAAGNVSGWSALRCAVTPLDDRELTASAGWTRTTRAKGWFAQSVSTSTRRGATLTRTHVQTSRLVLLAYRCPSCGSVTVLLNGKVFRTVSLAASSSGRVQVALPRFSLRTVTVTLRVATSGRPVRIDGLATSRV